MISNSMSPQIGFFFLLTIAIQLTECRLKIFIPNNDPIRNNITVYHPCYANQYKLCVTPNLTKEYSSISLETNCYSLSQNVHENSCLTQLNLQMPDEFICKSNYWNSNPHIFNYFTLKLSITKGDLSCQENDCFSNSIATMSYSKQYPPLIDCITELPSRCPSFGHIVISWTWLARNKNVCPIVKEIVTVLDFPISVPSYYGMTFKLPEPSKDSPYYMRFYRNHKQFFTLSLWFMFDKPCRASFCTLLHFLNEDDKLVNPLISFTNDGHIVIQGTSKKTKSLLGGKTEARLDVNKWHRLVLHWTPESWRLWVYEWDTVKINGAIYRYPEPVSINVARHFGILGTSVKFQGIDGYLGHTVWIHGKLVPVEKILDIKAPDYMLKLVEYNTALQKECSNTFNEINDYVKRVHLSAVQNSLKTVCQSWFQILNEKFIRKKVSKSLICPLRIRRPKLYKFVRRLLRGSRDTVEIISRPVQLDKTQKDELAQYLYDTAMMSSNKHGIKDLRRESRYFKDSFCYGNTEAGFVLSTLHYYGVGSATWDIWKAYTILMRNVMQNHRLSLIAMGAQFRFGHGITPTSLEPAYMYYKQAAMWTQTDMDLHSDEDVVIESVRLTNEIQLNEQTDENGDLYHWIKHQAEQGIPWAKKQLGLMYYWGSQGVKRDLTKAYNLLKKAAESPENPENLYDIAMLRLKGRGAEQNVTEAVQLLEKLAETNDSRAYNTLGWAAEMHEHNISKAIRYYKLAYKLGSVEAGYNLGTFYHSGRHKDLPKNKIRAFHLFQSAASKSMIHAGIMYADYLNKGIRNYFLRDPFMAVTWIQFVAERNAKIGIILRKGVKAYRSKNMLTSIFYYLMAAYTGHEIGAFNSALLCDENYDDITAYIASECVYRHFNQSVQRELHQTDSYSLIKMGDYYWYGCTGVNRDVNKSIDFYYLAAKKKEPQGYFNLAFVMEQGENISLNYLHKIGIETKKDRYEIIYELYKKCEALSPSNTYLPCQLAAARIYVKGILSSHDDHIKLVLCAIILLISLIGVISSRR